MIFWESQSIEDMKKTTNMCTVKLNFEIKNKLCILKKASTTTSIEAFEGFSNNMHNAFLISTTILNNILIKFKHFDATEITTIFYLIL